MSRISLNADTQKKIIALRDEIQYHRRRAEDAQDSLSKLLTGLGLKNGVELIVVPIEAEETGATHTA